MSIATKGGDNGQTSLVGNTRVSKGSTRVEAYGNVDELNSAMGFARSGRGILHLPSALRAARMAKPSSPCTRAGTRSSNSPRAQICASCSASIWRRKAMHVIWFLILFLTRFSLYRTFVLTHLCASLALPPSPNKA